MVELLLAGHAPQAVRGGGPTGTRGSGSWRSEPGHARRLARRTGQVWRREGWLGAVPLVPGTYPPRPSLTGYHVYGAGRWQCSARRHPGARWPRQGTGEATAGMTTTRGVGGRRLPCPPGTCLKVLARCSAGRQRRLRRLAAEAGPRPAGLCVRRAPGAGLRSGRLRAPRHDLRKDWAEKTSTDLARRFDVIRVEDLRIKQDDPISAKGTLRAAWAQRPPEGRAQQGDPAIRAGACWCAAWSTRPAGRVENINPAFTSQRCSACRQVDREVAREPSRLQVHRLRFRLQR